MRPRSISISISLALALGCSGERGLSWSYRFDGAALRDATTQLEATVLRGGCASATGASDDVVWSALFARGGDVMRPPALAAGRYGFRVRARDATCRWIAEECVELELPTDESGVVVELAASTTPELACPDGDACIDGRCEGEGDAGPPDGGSGDAGMDDGGPPGDAGSCAGCWDGDTCVTGDDGTACGTGGVACERCLCAGDSCSAGACTPASPIEQVSAGISHTCLIQGGHLWCWGGRGIGETGRGFATFASPGEVDPRDDQWDFVDAGGFSTCALRGTEMWCFGSNNGSQLGLGAGRPDDNEAMPVRVPGTTEWSQPGIGRYHSCAIDTSGALWCFGSNSQYSVGDDAPMSEVSSPVRITAFTEPVTSVSAGAFQTCAVSAGRLSCWGWNAYGELGNGGRPMRAASPTPIGASLGTWAEVAAGEGHTCARTAAGEVYCWGCGTDCDTCDFGYIEGGIDCTGVIGIGEGAMTYETTPRQVVGLRAQRIAHWNHACAIAMDGALFCWGPNHEGALGTGDTEPRLVPTEPWPGTRWSDVTVGGEHTCALRDTGALYCWGLNDRGQLGTGDMTPRRAPQRICL